MITEKDIWIAYKQAKEKKKDVKVPKNWENTIYNKLSSENKKILYDLMVNFNTKWQNINLYNYMRVGFSLWKSFSYKQFLNPKIINKYIEIDKRLKRSSEVSQEQIEKSLRFIYSDNSNLLNYSKRKSERDIHKPIEDYISNHIDKYTLCYLIVHGFLQVEDFEKNLIPYVMENFEEVKKALSKNMNIFREFEGGTMSDKHNKNYLEKKKKPGEDNENDEVEEIMIYDTDTLREKNKKKEEYQKHQLNE